MAMVNNVTRQTSKGRGMSNVDIANNPSMLREESFLRMKGLEGLVDILENMLRSARKLLLVCDIFVVYVATVSIFCLRCVFLFLVWEIRR